MSTGSIDGQIGFEDVSAEYQAFIDKFKPKKTTDDCYTPKEIYAEVLAWCRERYGIDPAKVVRPFWPGGDYKQFDYPKDCIVLDNPPFSILAQIIKDYNNSGIKYFLFSPYLTNLNYGMNCAHIVCDANITYENGACVATCFLTNLETDEILAISAPDLNARLKRVDAELRKKTTKQLPKYSYPVNVVTATMLGYMADHGVDYTLRKSDAVFVRALDSQRAAGKSLFGAGFLICEKAAAEKAAAFEWQLSEREREIIKQLGGNNDD